MRKPNKRNLLKKRKNLKKKVTKKPWNSFYQCYFSEEGQQMKGSRAEEEP